MITRKLTPTMKKLEAVDANREKIRQSDNANGEANGVYG
jgi:hypothetical protein